MRKASGTDSRPEEFSMRYKPNMTIQRLLRLLCYYRCYRCCFSSSSSYCTEQSAVLTLTLVVLVTKRAGCGHRSIEEVWVSEGKGTLLPQRRWA